MAVLQGLGSGLIDWPKKPGETDAHREPKRYAAYQRAKIQQDIKRERQARVRRERIGFISMPFGPMGRPQFRTFQEPLGLQAHQSLEDPEDAMGRGVEADVVRTWRKNAVIFGVVSLVLIALRATIDQMNMPSNYGSMLNLAIAGFLVLTLASGLTSYLVRRVVNDVQDRHRVRQARIDAIVMRKRLEE